MIRTSWRVRRRKIGLRPLLLSLPLLAVLPVLVYGGVLLSLMGDQARAATERELQAGAHALATSVERDVKQAEQALALLGNADALGAAGPADEAALHSLAEHVLRGHFGLLSIALLEPDGRVAFLHPLRPGLGQGRITLQPAQQRVLATGQPALTDLHPGAFDGQPVMTLNVPVHRGGKVRWVLSGRLDPNHLAATLSALVPRSDSIATLFDGRHQIAARTEQMERFFAQMPSRQTLAALATGPSGTRRFYTRDGKELLWSWVRLANGWTAMMGTPAQTIARAQRELLLRLVMLGLAVLALGAAASAALARRIVRSVDAMADNAHRLVDGDNPPYRPTGIRQIDALYADLETASALAAQALAERERALASAQAARAVADEHNRNKDVFIATLSHELRNPLAPIRAAAGVLKSPHADAAKKAWAADVIERQTRAMARLLDDLLDLSRVTRGRIVLQRRRVALAEVLDDAAELVRPLVDARRHTLSIAPVDPALVVDADPLRLTQVFGNLLTNAARYTEPGGRIEVEARREGGEVVVRVRDNGVGLAPEALERIFGLFTQVRDEAAVQDGLGIGLSLVRGLVTLHGGSVTALSEGRGRGATFVVRLPSGG